MSEMKEKIIILSLVRKTKKKGCKRWLIKTGLKQYPQSGAINSKENRMVIELSNLQAYELYSL